MWFFRYRMVRWVRIITKGGFSMGVSRNSTTPKNGHDVRSELQSALSACNHTIAQLRKLKREILGEIPPENIPQKVLK